MAWHQIGEEALSEPMMAQFTDTYMRLSAPMNKTRNKVLREQTTSFDMFVTSKRRNDKVLILELVLHM